MFIYQVYGSSSFRPSYRVVLLRLPASFNLKNNLLLFRGTLAISDNVLHTRPRGRKTFHRGSARRYRSPTDRWRLGTSNRKISKKIDEFDEFSKSLVKRSMYELSDLLLLRLLTKCRPIVTHLYFVTCISTFSCIKRRY